MKSKSKKIKIPKQVIVEIILIILVSLGIGYYFVNVHLQANNSAPQISIVEGSNVFSVTASEEDFLKDVSATDNEDGDVTESIIIESISPIFDGKSRTITYVAFDSNNNVTKLERDITYSDYQPPTFICEKNIFVPSGDYTEILANVKATDVVDGDISNQIKIEVNNVVKDVPGNYAVQLTVTNSCGDVSATNIVVTVTGEEVA